jgi:hypothetical protein
MSLQEYLPFFVLLILGALALDLERASIRNSFVVSVVAVTMNILPAPSLWMSLMSYGVAAMAFYMFPFKLLQNVAVKVLRGRGRDESTINGDPINILHNPEDAEVE